MKTNTRVFLTSAFVLATAGIVTYKYWDYLTNPWTRDGQVRAQVIQITPRVSAPIVNLPIKDNQFVKTGDLLFEIDPRTFRADLDKARADLDKTPENVKQRVGTTASVLVMTGTAGSKDAKPVPATPRALQ